MRHLAGLLAACIAICVAASTQAGDASVGRGLAQSRCAPCHQVAPWQREELANAPPFELIARKFAGNPAMLASELRRPHRKMNFLPTPSEAEDIAEYIRSLAR